MMTLTYIVHCLCACVCVCVYVCVCVCDVIEMAEVSHVFAEEDIS